MTAELVSVAPRDLAAVSDLALLEGIRRGDEDAFAALMKRKTQPLFRVAYRLVGEREEARDIVQLTFLRVWQKRSTFNDKWSPNTWLYRIATNLAIDCLRARASRRRRLEPLKRHLFHLVESRRQREPSGLRQREVHRILEELAEGLTEKQRIAFLLREVEGLSSKEVADILQCRPSTVRNHLFTARRYLRRKLLERYPEYAQVGGVEKT